MNPMPLQDHSGWQWCTAEGAELHTLLLGLRTTFADKLIWLEEAENLALAMRADREKMQTSTPAPSSSSIPAPTKPSRPA